MARPKISELVLHVGSDSHAGWEHPQIAAAYNALVELVREQDKEIRKLQRSHQVAVDALSQDITSLGESIVALTKEVTRLRNRMDSADEFLLEL